ncbi:MAG: hypothetical protein IT381_20625 [Deltaproteobacteria bacterium]|nr:hypothetical protein [Deltaproteobacteria bacterium]
MKAPGVMIVCVASAALGFFAARRLEPPPQECAAPASCPAETVCPAPAPVAKAEAPRRAIAPATLPAAPPEREDTAAIARAIRACVSVQRSYAGSTLALKMRTDPKGRVKQVELQGAEFLAEGERRCVRQQAKTWTLDPRDEEIIVHVSM